MGGPERAAVGPGFTLHVAKARGCHQGRSIVFPDAGHTPRVLMLLPFSLKLMQHDCLQKYSSNLMLKGEKERQINN